MTVSQTSSRTATARAFRNMGVKRIVVTRRWAEDRRACALSVVRFFKLYPRGLTVTRRNLHRAAETMSRDDLYWFTRELSRFRNASYDKVDALLRREAYTELSEVMHMLNAWPFRRKSSHQWAEALADVLELP